MMTDENYGGTLNALKLSGSNVVKLGYLQTLTAVAPSLVASQLGLQSYQYVSIEFGFKIYPAVFLIVPNIDRKWFLLDNGCIPIFQDPPKLSLSSYVHWMFARSVHIMVMDEKEGINTQQLTSFLRYQLQVNRVKFMAGMTLVVQYLSQQIHLVIQKIEPVFLEETIQPSEFVFCIHSKTEVILTGPSLQNDMDSNVVNCVKFSDIGGYETELRMVKAIIDEHLQEAAQLQNLNLNAILISGMSGTGKSMIGKALEYEYRPKCLRVSSEDLRSKYEGESEKALKELFSKASSMKPSVIFIDDIDLVCQNRNSGVNASLVTALLQILDGVDRKSENRGVLLVASAAEPKSVDAALRRSGRLSTDIILKVPSASERESILTKLLSRLPKFKLNVISEDVAELAAKTSSFTGGDLQTLILEGLAFAEEGTLSNNHLFAALKDVVPASLRKSAFFSHEISLKSVLGLQEIKKSLMDAFTLSLHHKDVFTHAGLAPPQRFLVFGPPACGKTMLIQALASHFSLRLIPVQRSRIFGKFFGESERNLAKVFVQARESSPCIVHFENFEGIGGRRRRIEGTYDVEGRLINQLKVTLDGIEGLDEVFVIAETSRPDLLDKNAIRPGRFHKYVYVGLPSPEDRSAIIQNYLESMDDVHPELLTKLIKETAGFSTAEVLQFCGEVFKDYSVNSCEHDEIFNAHVSEILNMIVPSTSAAVLKIYKEFAQNFCAT